ncbi:transporter substrate-binding domain-containing protein [Aestuariirhabdus sp. Z084]|uniref:substrate-binding periplasmic protein n=1 Tax=Aestuariirhabdus haliotis TaxID=2918751 RepID=UPI00201B3FE0|nr:transporter substrate-binding domain-containing protein [Aestuariirhabdus haliotis]MCL6414660.1 transporter substrate-binding domain-containing protein [Aestuariirhabdus haliotis]MCL6418358.1 transporter substrate-binding domain-containing protein [Aestuariirhabdus haliotis]
MPLLQSWLVLLALFLPAAAYPDSLQVSTSTVKPWGYVNAQGQLDGLLSRFTLELEKHSGITLNNTLTPYPRVIQEVKSGQADLAVLFKSPQADQYGIDLGEVVKTSIIITARADAPPINSLDALAGKRVGYIRGSRYGASFDDNLQLYKVPIRDMAQGVRMLMQGRIEAMVSADYTLFYTLRELDIEPTRLVHLLTLDSNSGHLYLSRRSTKPDSAANLQKALEEMRSNGILQQIFFKPYLSDRLNSPSNNSHRQTNTPWLVSIP